MNLTDNLNNGADYFNVDYSTSSFIGILFITLLLGFAILFLVSSLYSKNSIVTNDEIKQSLNNTTSNNSTGTPLNSTEVTQ